MQGLYISELLGRRVRLQETTRTVLVIYLLLCFYFLLNTLMESIVKTCRSLWIQSN